MSGGDGETTDYDAEGGSATGIFVMFERCGRDDYLIANGASIGDTAAILCYAGTLFNHYS